MTELLDMIGKFHPLILHLPIGVMVYAYLHLAFDLYIRRKKQPVDIQFALLVGAFTAILSSISGYLLSQNGEYGVVGLLDWHKWLGIATAIASVLILVLYQRLKGTNLFFGFFTLFMILLTATGHFGGSLTHGEGFLSPNKSKDQEPTSVDDITKAHIFNDIMMPIVKRKCTSCHNEKKTKGKLLLTTLDGWKKGGKTGKFVVPGDLENSLILTRIHLPISEKKHMPPSGKLQLVEDEITFINWWVEFMSNFDETVEDLSPPDHIMEYVKSKLDASIIAIPKIDNATILALQKSGIPVRSMAMDQPWLSIVYDRGRSIKKDDLRKLSKVKENVRELVLSKTGLTDKLLSRVNNFKNLKTLDISLNPVTSKGILKLDRLSKLENLNLYGSNVDGKILRHLTKFPALQDIYLWQTNITKADVRDTKLPKGLTINLGQDLSAFGDVQLSPPAIEGEKVIFQDSLWVAISHIAKKARIHYTLNGDLPTHNSQIYSEEILIDKTSELKAVAILDGWENSEVVSRAFLKSSNIPVACTITPLPNEKYSSDGSETLINSIKGTEQFGDGKWLGFSAQDVSITLDLGGEKIVKSVSFGSLQDYRSYIFNPLGSTISISSDGVAFDKLQEEKYVQITGPEDNLVKDYIIDLPSIKTRYIKLDIIGQKKNPKWHSDPGADCWLFLDEVVVE